MRALLPAATLARHGDRIRAAAPGAVLLGMDADGTIRAAGDAVHGEDAAFDCAYGATELWDREHQEATRNFFVAALKNPELRWFHVAAAGVDSPVFGALLDNGVRLTTSHHTAIPISEYVLAQVLRHRLPLDVMESDRRERAWRNRQWDEVASSRWLVVGVGHIGTEVASRARAFGAHVTGVRRTPDGSEPVDAMCTPDELLSVVGDHDVIVLAAPATAATEGLVDTTFLTAMAEGTILVNVGRGALIDEDALRTSLELGRPARAVLDVASEEPPADDHWLWTHDRVTLTAHTSAGGRQGAERAADAFAENLRRFVTGDDLLDEIQAGDR